MNRYGGEANPPQDWFDQFTPDPWGPQSRDANPAVGDGQGGMGAPGTNSDPTMRGAFAGANPAVGLDGQTPEGAGGWWSTFGAPPNPYTSNPWAGGPAPTFRPATGADLTTDPGYQFRLQQGTQALDRGFAAGGTLLNGGTAKALARYNQDYASTELGKANDRALQTFGAENQNYQTRYGQYLGENARTLSDWLQNLTAKRNAENDYWSRLSGVSDRGYGAAGQGQGA